MKWESTYNNGILELVHTSEEGGAIIRSNKNGSTILYEVPQYGGEPRLEGVFGNICEAIEIAETWT